MLVSVVSRGEGCLTELARVAANAREVDALNMILNMLLSVIDLSTNVAFIFGASASIVHKLVYVRKQKLSAWKLKQFNTYFKEFIARCDAL
jgi:hypothetical protein